MDIVVSAFAVVVALICLVATIYATRKKRPEKQG